MHTAQGSKVPSKVIGPISDECMKDIDTSRGIITFYIHAACGLYSRPREIAGQYLWLKPYIQQ